MEDTPPPKYATVYVTFSVRSIESFSFLLFVYVRWPTLEGNWDRQWTKRQVCLHCVVVSEQIQKYIYSELITNVFIDFFNNLAKRFFRRSSRIRNTIHVY